MAATSAAEKNRQARIDLAVAYRALEKLGLSEGIDNHLTVMAPAASGEGEVMLINSYGSHWSEITASSLIGLDKEAKVVEGEGQPQEAAIAVHLGLRQIQPNTPCSMHTHMPYATALGMLEDPRIKLVHQNSGMFWGKVAYDDSYQGIPNATEEGRRLGKIMGDRQVLMMQNHGVLVVGSSVSEAFSKMFFLERACMFQVLAYSTGKPVREFPESVTKQQGFFVNREFQLYHADLHFNAVKRKVIRDTPDVLQ